MFAHTLGVFARVETILEAIDHYFPEVSSELRQRIDMDKTALLKTAILLRHAASARQEARVDCTTAQPFKPQKECADVAKQICKRLKFSRRQSDFIVFVIGHQFAPLCLFAAWRSGRLTNRLRTRFFMHCEPAVPELLLHAMADISEDEEKSDESLRKFIDRTLKEFYREFKPKRSLPPLISGDDLVEHFGLQPSPLFKKILRQVEERRLSGEIKTREKALRYTALLVQKIPRRGL
jgi:poly(A) polymerase